MYVRIKYTYSATINLRTTDIVARICTTNCQCNDYKERFSRDNATKKEKSFH